GIRAIGRRVFRLDDHLARLATSAKAIALELPLTIDAIKGIVLDTRRARGRADAYIRLLVTRGEGPLGVDPANCARPSVICIVADVQIFPPEKRAVGLHPVPVSLSRPALDTVQPPG